MSESRPVPPYPSQPHPQQPQHPQQASKAPGQAPAGQAPQPALRQVVAPMPRRQHDPHLDSIALVDDDPMEIHAGAPTEAHPKHKIQQLGISSHVARTDFNRKTCVTGTGACRVRSFHGRLSDEGMAYMDEKINEWLDAHTDIEIKHVTTTVGLYDGKIKEQALVVNIWY